VAQKTLPGVVLPPDHDPAVVLADEGVFFQASPEGPVQFVRSDGRVDVGSLPVGASLRGEPMRVGARWLLAETGSSRVLLSSSEDGKVWSQRSWNLDDEGSSSLELFGQNPMLVFGHNGTLLFPVPDPLPDDASAKGGASTFAAERRVWQLGSKGSSCTVGYALEASGGGSATALVYPERQGWSGWWFPSKGTKAADGLLAQRLVCRPTPRKPAGR
jgi:hypothetical protein